MSEGQLTTKSNTATVTEPETVWELSKGYGVTPEPSLSQRGTIYFKSEGDALRLEHPKKQGDEREFFEALADFLKTPLVVQTQADTWNSNEDPERQYWVVVDGDVWTTDGKNVREKLKADSESIPVSWEQMKLALVQASPVEGTS